IGRPKSRAAPVSKMFGSFFGGGETTAPPTAPPDLEAGPETTQADKTAASTGVEVDLDTAGAAGQDLPQGGGTTSTFEAATVADLLAGKTVTRLAKVVSDADPVAEQPQAQLLNDVFNTAKGNKQTGAAPPPVSAAAAQRLGVSTSAATSGTSAATAIPHHAKAPRDKSATMQKLLQARVPAFTEMKRSPDLLDYSMVLIVPNPDHPEGPANYPVDYDDAKDIYENIFPIQNRALEAAFMQAWSELSSFDLTALSTFEKLKYGYLNYSPEVVVAAPEDVGGEVDAGGGLFAGG
ncbi:unnamed protein product, partial [Amoebophrya sp. A120]